MGAEKPAALTDAVLCIPLRHKLLRALGSYIGKIRINFRDEITGLSVLLLSMFEIAWLGLEFCCG